MPGIEAAMEALRKVRILCWLSMLCALAPAAARSGGSVGVSEVTGKEAALLLNRPTASFRLYAFRAGAAVPIPFQVDERDHRDHWADDAGPQPVRDESPGIFDENDVVVFMNRDLGDKGNPANLPAGAATWLEVRVGPTILMAASMMDGVSIGCYDRECFACVRVESGAPARQTPV